MPFYLSCGNCHQRNPDRRNQRHGALEIDYFFAWRMMGFAYHVRYCMVTDRAPVPDGLGPFVKSLDASDVCAWNCLLLHGCGAATDNHYSKLVFDRALRTIERIYAIEEPGRQLADHLNATGLQTAPLMTRGRLCDLIVRHFKEMDEDDAAPLVQWYKEQEWFETFAAKMLRQIIHIKPEKAKNIA